MSRQSLHTNHALSTKTRLWSTGPTPSQVSYKSIHYHDGEETIDPEIGSHYINRITLVTRSRSRPEVEECRGRPLFHVIPRKTCSIDPTFIQKLTRFDSPGTRKSRFYLQFRSACSIHCICDKINTFPSFGGIETQINNFARKLNLFDQKSDHGIFLITFRKNLI